MGVLFFFCLMGIGEQQAWADCISPETLSVLSKRLPGWKVVGLNDLRSNDKKTWGALHPSDCPGVVEGHFESSNARTVAITLFRRSPVLQQTLVVVNHDANRSRLTVLSEPQQVAYLSVISKKSPGEYSGVEGDTVSLVRDSISYEAIEAGALLFYFKEGRYLSLLVGE
jgi:hypothetical protein